MNIKEIEKLADLLNAKGLTSLEYSEGDKTIRLGKTYVNTEFRGVGFSSPQESAPADGTGGGNSPPPQTGAADPSLHTVVSPIVGVFYSAPAPDAKPFVSLGDTVKDGDVLCVVEAMKMMNEIVSDVAGEVVELCASNKQIVEFDQPLFKVRTV